MPAQHLRDGQHQVGGGDALAQRAVELHADDGGRQHVERLVEHDRLGLDAADAPAQDAQTVDHGRVRVGADQRVGEGQRLAAPLLAHDDAGQVLQVDLVDDPRRWRHDPEVVEGFLAPAQELVALAVALEFLLGVIEERRLRAEQVDLHRMVDDQVDRHERVDLLGVAAEAAHRVAHRRQVDDGRHAGEVLQDYPRRLERQFFGDRRIGRPTGEPEHIIVGDLEAIGLAQRRLQQDLDRERQPVDRRAGRRRQSVQPVDDDRAGRGGKGGARAE